MRRITAGSDSAATRGNQHPALYRRRESSPLIPPALTAMREPKRMVNLVPAPAARRFLGSQAAKAANRGRDQAAGGRHMRKNAQRGLKTTNQHKTDTRARTDARVDDVEHLLAVGRVDGEGRVPDDAHRVVQRAHIAAADRGAKGAGGELRAVHAGGAQDAVRGARGAAMQAPGIAGRQAGAPRRQRRRRTG